LPRQLSDKFVTLNSSLGGDDEHAHAGAGLRRIVAQPLS
jgi:hypothetical protein